MSEPVASSPSGRGERGQDAAATPVGSGVTGAATPLETLLPWAGPGPPSRTEIAVQAREAAAAISECGAG